MLDTQTFALVESSDWRLEPSRTVAAIFPDDPDAADRRILIVDDEAPVREMYAEYLRDDHREDHFECQTAASAEEALEELAKRSYALVISDMMMPGRNGVELLRDVTARYPQTAVIMVSGVDRPQRVRDALRLGAFDYLIKPCELDVLRLSVERALERRSLQHTARVYKRHLETQNIELASRQRELERLQAQLIQTEKMASLGQLAAGVAHELNNPAGFVYGNMDLLRGYIRELEQLCDAYDRLDLPAEAAAAIAALKVQFGYESLISNLASIISDCGEGAQRICDVVKNLRLFSRLDEAEFKSIDIHDGIDSTIRLLSSYYGTGEITLQRDYQLLPAVNCYAAQLNQVWMNLLVNAAQAVGERGAVKISTGFDGSSVTVAISDTGVGIPEDDQSHIFEPFFTTKPVGEGTGLGLSTSYGIIKRHGGSIVVASEVGAGTTFTVRIPIRVTEGGWRVENSKNFPED